MLYKELLELDYIDIKLGYLSDSVILNDVPFYLMLESKELDTKKINDLLNKYLENHYPALIKRFGKRKGILMLRLFDNDTGKSFGFSRWYNKNGKC